MRMKHQAIVIAAVLTAALAPAFATFHFMKIVEIFPGTAIAPNAQYVVLQMYASRQNLVAGHNVTVFDASDVPIATFTFPSDVGNGNNQAKILIATPQAQSFFGITADLTMTSAVLAAGGKACFADSVDCVAWGNYSGSPLGVGVPFNASGGLRPGQAMIRRLDIAGSPGILDADDDTENSAADFVAGVPAPGNNAGLAGTAPASTCGNNLLEGLEQCDDGNLASGDGCSSVCVVDAITGTPSLPPLHDARRLDINGDGRADLTWRNNIATHFAYWRMLGASLGGSASFQRDASWRVLASGDFNGDTLADIIWTNGQHMELWTSNSVSFFAQLLGNYPTGWQVAGVGDVNGDGRADLFWRHDSGLHVAYWLMNGGSIIGSWATSASPDWSILGTGDFDADHRLDILWTNGSALVLWQGAPGGNFAGLAMPGYPTGWDLAGVGDVNGDGRSDLLWRDQAQTHLVYWLMQGPQLVGAAAFAVGADWRVVESDDYSGDGKLDIAWTNGSAMVLWQGAGSSFVGLLMPNYPVGWSVNRR